jgi:MerR family transcriptional regulator, light-induced transcriptional regulator
MADERAVLRIGEVARRTGVAVSTLRAWERRYGLLDPVRTDGGHRLYSERDVARVRAVQDLIDQGWTASSAAEEVRATPADVTRLAPVPAGGDPTGALVDRLKSAMDRFDATGADDVLDDTLARLDVGMALDEVVMPALRWVGEGWEDDPRIVAREHFASNALRPRLLRMLRTSLGVSGRVCVAAAPEDEQHDLSLLAASVTAASAGWQVHFLGARTPTAALERTAVELDARIVLVACVFREHAEAFLAKEPNLGGALAILGGPGFEPSDADRLPGSIVHTGHFRDLPRAIDAGIRAQRGIG